MPPSYVQYGCGLHAPDGWINFDSSPSLRAQKLPVIGRLLARRGPPFPTAIRYGDIVRGLPVPDGSCRAIYCSHVLEHLSLEDCRTALRNTFRCLAPSGVFRLLVPDMELVAREYLASTDPSAAVTFVSVLQLGRVRRPRGLVGFARGWVGNSPHLWMWDYRALAAELVAVGFADIRRAAYGDAADPAFKVAETVERWERSVGIECRRPGGAVA